MPLAPLTTQSSRAGRMPGCPNLVAQSQHRLFLFFNHHFRASLFTFASISCWSVCCEKPEAKQRRVVALQHFCPFSNSRMSWMIRRKVWRGTKNEALEWREEITQWELTSEGRRLSEPRIAQRNSASTTCSGDAAPGFNYWMQDLWSEGTSMSTDQFAKIRTVARKCCAIAHNSGASKTTSISARTRAWLARAA